jgi:hypothetical protein
MLTKLIVAKAIKEFIDSLAEKQSKNFDGIVDRGFSSFSQSGFAILIMLAMVISYDIKLFFLNLVDFEQRIKENLNCFKKFMLK